MNKALVIEDECGFRSEARKFSNGQFVAPDTLSEIEKELRNTKYSAILIDGTLDRFQDNERELCGEHIVKAIRGGGYGPVNQNTPLFSYSSQYINGLMPSGINKRRGGDYTRQGIEAFIQKYLQENQE